MVHFGMTAGNTVHMYRVKSGTTLAVHGTVPTTQVCASCA